MEKEMGTTERKWDGTPDEVRSFPKRKVGSGRRNSK